MIGERHGCCVSPAHVIAHAMIEFEFHISPECNSITTPDRCRSFWKEVKQSLGDCRIVGQTTRALNGFVEVGDDAVAPAAVLVAKDAQAHGAASANGTLCNHATLLAMFVGDWGLLDHKPSAREVHFKSAVVEIVAFTVVDHRVTRLVDATVQPDEVAACAQRQPVEVHPELKAPRC